MEIDSVLMGHKKDCTGDTSAETSTSPGSPDANNVFGDPLLNPRVGEKYQVDIPSLIKESERLKLLADPFDSQSVDTSLVFMVGLPVPITWVTDSVNNIEDGKSEPAKKLKGTLDVNTSSEARNCKKGQSSSRKKSSEPNAEEPKNQSRSDSLEPMSHSQLNGSRNYYPVPGLTTYPWNDTKVDSFLLGLYIYGKNFILIRRFMGITELGEIQTYYYGKFYRSDAHRRWSRSRKKVRRKKCVIGRKIFTGWRQQELLSRLSLRVSEESKKLLMEGYKSFAEGQTSYEEYIFLLKSTVGIPVLVEVIGIGKGKDDLTSIAMDPGKSNQDNGQQIPTGQDCSSLTANEIVNLLTGGFRLSKGRCNDIFWDAVWPRLLAKGWHSEQPRNQGYVSSKNYLVFLLPGVKKFSRRKLAKGAHYFDSVSDVLNKVASEPQLIELESEKSSAGGRTKPDSWSPEAGSDQDDQSGSRRRCYLKPRVSTSSSCQLKFTVVDTSSTYGGRSASIIELRYLPAELKKTSKMTSHFIDDEEDSSEDGLDEFKRVETKPLQGDRARRVKGVSDGGDGSSCMKFTVVDTSLFLGRKKPSKLRDLRCLPLLANGISELTGSGDFIGKQEKYASNVLLKGKRKISKFNSRDDDHSYENQVVAKNNSDSAITIDIKRDPSTSTSGEKHEKRTVLKQFQRRAKPRHIDSVVPVVKRRRLTACAKAKTTEHSQTCSKSLSSKQTDLPETNNLNLASEGSSRGADHPDEDDIKLKILRRNCSAKKTTETSNNLDRPLDSMDNGVKIDREANKPVIADGHCAFPKDNEIVSVDANQSEQNVAGIRRHSTRNRPLTTRALEALANGFLNVQRRRSKSSRVLLEGNQFSNPCRKARSSKAKVGPSHSNDVSDIVSSKEDSEPVGRAEENWDTNH